MKKKNVLFWCGVKSEDAHLRKKHGNFEYLDLSKKCWQYWCQKNDVIFFEYHSTSESDTSAHKVTWQRWFDVFDLIEDANIDYNKIAVIDGSTLIRHDTPNFFNIAPSGKLTAFRSLENLRWISDSIDGYNDFFNNFNFDMSKYISCGFQIFDETHKSFLNLLKKFYYDNYDKIMYHQNQTVKKGTDQSVYNYLLQIHDIDVYREMPPPYMLTHLNRFDWFSHNWQLNEDNTPFYIKYGYIWFYSGFPNRGDRFNLMQQTWNFIKDTYE
tara:strand:+ start:5502 stop:6308 length:807 start_codon:yes stop_codon:yes gene_type:complete